MRNAGSARRWILVAMVALLAAMAWTSFRGNGPLPVPVPPSASLPEAPLESPIPARPARTPTPDDALEQPPPLPPDVATRQAPPAFLPPEAIDTLQRIARGGPYPYRQDDGVFQNRERRLPPKPRGYYREYTVETPGSDDRGARRIVTGGRPPAEYFYTEDHYRSFRRFTLEGFSLDGAADGMESTR